MERSKRIQLMAIAFLAIFHTVGIVGLSWENSRELFLQLVPLNLLLSGGVLFAFHKKWSWPFVGVAMFIFLAGYGIEVLGVSTGKIFGEYSYGAALGFKLWEVPPLIGLNWLILVYCSVIVVQRLSLSLPIKIALAASIITVLDALIEPVAIRLDFWSWTTAAPPLQNFIAWFVIGAGFIALMLTEKTPKSNPIAMPLLIIQAVFFAILLFVG